ncbi:hypothetical protein, partial [Amycolatopsis sp. NPDC003676]
MTDNTPTMPSVHFLDFEKVDIELGKRRIDRLLRPPRTAKCLPAHRSSPAARPTRTNSTPARPGP